MSEAVGTCSCGGNILDEEKRYRCEKCKKYVWKEFFWTEIPKETAVSLMRGESVFVDGLYSKKKDKHFGANLSLEQEKETGYWKIRLSFDDDKEEK